MKNNRAKELNSIILHLSVLKMQIEPDREK
jgi:hypothetical protein